MTEALFEDTRHPTGAPYVADESTTLRTFLDFHRATLLRQVAGLDHEQLNRPFPPTTMTLAGLLKHMAFVEDTWFGVRLAGNAPVPPFDTAPWDDDQEISLRWILVHMIEEYARHCGHADLMREAIDGKTDL
ncbi:DinB family protein [Nocardioides sp. NPDC057767]|uniref:DinB family protein n=1 Tax=unclassified Nocardioides TaxID=2615069 RepID=UPI00366F0915